MPNQEVDVDGPDIGTLWLIFGQIGTAWGNAQHCVMPESQFKQAVNWQVQLNPAYLNYYNLAIARYAVLSQESGGNQQWALQQLFAENRLPNTQSPQIAEYVLLEFMRWQVAFGGFRAFGYENYNGWTKPLCGGL